MPSNEILRQLARFRVPLRSRTGSIRSLAREALKKEAQQMELGHLSLSSDKVDLSKRYQKEFFND